MAPSLAINLNPQAPALHVGRAVPLVFLLAVVGVMLVAYGFIRLCQSFHHAGSVYAFIGVTVGPRAGFVAGWTLFGTYLAYTATSVAAFGLFIQQFCIDDRHLGRARAGCRSRSLAYVTIWVLAANEARLQHPHAGHDRDGHGDADRDRGDHDLRQADRRLGARRADVHDERLHPAARGRLLGAVLLADVRLPVVRRLRGSVDDGRGDAEPDRAIPLAIFGCVVFAGMFYVFVSMAETMGFGTDAAGVTAFTSSGNLMGDLAQDVPRTRASAT